MEITPHRIKLESRDVLLHNVAEVSIVQKRCETTSEKFGLLLALIGSVFFFIFGTTYSQANELESIVWYSVLCLLFLFWTLIGVHRHSCPIVMTPAEFDLQFQTNAAAITAVSSSDRDFLNQIRELIQHVAAEKHTQNAYGVDMNNKSIVSQALQST